MNSFTERIRHWFLPILLVILLLIVFGYYQSKISTTAPSITQKVQEQEQEKSKKGFAKPKELTVTKKAASDNEGMSVALRSGAVSDCDRIKYDDELKQLCIDQINYANSVKADDESGCNLIEDEILQDLCNNKVYFTIGIQNRDSAVCEKITDENLKFRCLEQVTAGLAKESGSIEDCNLINSEKLKINCRDNVTLKSVADTKDTADCEKFSSQSMQEQCKTVVTQNALVAQASKDAAVSKKIIRSNDELLAICDSLNGNQESDCKNAIYPKIAFDEKNLTYCNNISDESLAEDCKAQQGQAIDEFYLRSSIASGSKDPCQQISNSALKEVCINS